MLIIKYVCMRIIWPFWILKRKKKSVFFYLSSWSRHFLLFTTFLCLYFIYFMLHYMYVNRFFLTASSHLLFVKILCKVKMYIFHEIETILAKTTIKNDCRIKGVFSILYCKNILDRFIGAIIVLIRCLFNLYYLLK